MLKYDECLRAVIVHNLDIQMYERYISVRGACMYVLWVDQITQREERNREFLRNWNHASLFSGPTESCVVGHGEHVMEHESLHESLYYGGTFALKGGLQGEGLLVL